MYKLLVIGLSSFFIISLLGCSQDNSSALKNPPEKIASSLVKDESYDMLPNRLIELAGIAESGNELSEAEEYEFDDLYAELDQYQNEVLLGYLKDKKSNLSVRYRTAINFTIGNKEEGYRGLGQMLLKNMDISSYTWGWLHTGNEDQFEYHFLSICKAMLKDYPNLQGEEQLKAEKLIRGFLDYQGKNLDVIYLESQISEKLSVIRRYLL